MGTIVNPKDKAPTNTSAAEAVALPEPSAGPSAELRARWDELRTRMGRSRLSVEPPSGYTPYWARKNDTSELARLDYLGFRIVREVPGTPNRYKAQGAREDGTYVMGDVILMEIRTEDYEFYLSENSKKAAGMSEAAKEKFREDAERAGAPTFKVNRKA